jgi:hypothetical protein
VSENNVLRRMMFFFWVLAPCGLVGRRKKKP